MAGNKSVYAEALRKGHNLAWEGRYELAVQEYRRALAEFPEDVAANTSLGAACLHLRDLPEALAAYQAVQRKVPQDLLSLAKIAEIQATLGQQEEADRSYSALVKAYTDAGLASKVLEALQQMASLLPDHVSAHTRLAEAYGAAGKTAEASAECLVAARLCQHAGQFPEAVENLERALLYDAENREAEALLGSLRGEPPGPQRAEPSPTQQAALEAQERLAQEVFAAPAEGPAASGDQQQRAEMLVTHALDLQARGDVNAAIAAYRQVIDAGIHRAEVEYNLGLLYQQAGRYAEAIEHLSLTAKLPDYAVGSHLAIGRCYQNQEQHDLAMEHFLAAAGALNLATIEREQLDDVIGLYRSLADGYKMRGQPEKALAAVNSLVDALSTKGWDAEAAAVSGELRGLETGQAAAPPAPVEAAVPEWRVVAQKLSSFDTLLQEQHYLAAIEECHDIINLAPSYLPVHYRLGTVYTQQGRTEHAVEKYLTLATLHVVRNELAQALEACRLAVSAAPHDPRPRSRLAQMLLDTGDTEKALEELDVLGDLQLQRGLREEAKATIRQIIALEPPDVEGYQQLLEQLEAQR